jgi:hypothetical protein
MKSKFISKHNYAGEYISFGKNNKIKLESERVSIKIALPTHLCDIITVFIDGVTDLVY